VRKLFAGLRRADGWATSLSRAQKVNAALYALALAGLGLIAVEVRQTEVAPREVRSLPAPVTPTTGRPAVEPGERRPVQEAGVVPPSAPEPSPADTGPVGPVTSGGRSGTGSTETEGGRGGAPAASQPAAVSPVPASPPVPLGSSGAPLVTGGAPAGMPGMSLVPQPPPLPALPPPSPRADLPFPDMPAARSPAVPNLPPPPPPEPVLATPPAPRVTDPAIGGLG
jgi:hypothetical protein